ncbi:MAG: hypothetical protein Q9175_005561 [Cornicularia normoerica]
MESSKKKEDKKEDTINAEGANQPKAEDATQVNTSPPTLDEMIAALTAATQKDPIAFRRYVAVLADTTPQAPPDLYGDAFRQWQYRHLRTSTSSAIHLSIHPSRLERKSLSETPTNPFTPRTVTATLSHLLAVFKNHDDPQQHAWWYYDAFLKVNNTDYKDSPFMPTASAKALFKQ